MTREYAAEHAVVGVDHPYPAHLCGSPGHLHVGSQQEGSLQAAPMSLALDTICGKSYPYVHMNFSATGMKFARKHVDRETVCVAMACVT